MRMRPPVDLLLTVIELVTLLTQTRRRKKQCGRIVPPTNRCDADTQPLSFHRDSEFLGVGETTPVRPAIAHRISWRWSCQDTFAIRLLSSAASISAYLWAGARKKKRRPIDLHVAVIEPVTPPAQTPRREKQRGYIVTHTRPPPVHRLHIHRPERLDGTRTRVRTHPKAPSLTRVGAVLSALLMALFPANSRRCSACLRVSSVLTRCFIQHSNVFFDNPCRRQYSDGSIHFSATRRARV
jgi:hypothetical protein